MSYKNIENKIVKVTPNHRYRTFTIRTNSGKYRTLPMSKDEFEDALYNTSDDWINFLKTDAYYLLTK